MSDYVLSLTFMKRGSVISAITCLLQDVDVECVAILNDTVGCLMSCAFLDHHAEIGVILGTCVCFSALICCDAVNP